MSEQWLSIVEYARQTNMSDMTIRRRIKTGRIQAVLRDGKYFIPMSEAIKKIGAPTNFQQQHPPHKPQQTLHRPSTNQNSYLRSTDQRPQMQEPQFDIAPPSFQTLLAPPAASPLGSDMSRAPRHDDPFSGNAVRENPKPIVEETRFQPSPIPTQFRNTLVQQGATQASVDSSTLIAFCEGALRKANDAEHRLEAFYKEAIGKLEAEIKSRDHQIKALSQQVEDLQLLTKILEKKK